MKEGCEKAGVSNFWDEGLEGVSIGFMDCYPSVARRTSDTFQD